MPIPMCLEGYQALGDLWAAGPASSGQETSLGRDVQSWTHPYPQSQVVWF